VIFRTLVIPLLCVHLITAYLQSYINWSWYEGVNKFAYRRIRAQNIARITDFTVKYNALPDPVNTADRGIKQEFWNGLRILNYFDHGLRNIVF